MDYIVWTERWLAGGGGGGGGGRGGGPGVGLGGSWDGLPSQFGGGTNKGGSEFYGKAAFVGALHGCSRHLNTVGSRGTLRYISSRLSSVWVVADPALSLWRWCRCSPYATRCSEAPPGFFLTCRSYSMARACFATNCCFAAMMLQSSNNSSAICL